MLELLGVQRRAEELVLEPVAEAVRRQLDRRARSGRGFGRAAPGASAFSGFSTVRLGSVSTGSPEATSGTVCRRFIPPGESSTGRQDRTASHQEPVKSPRRPTAPRRIAGPAPPQSAPARDSDRTARQLPIRGRRRATVPRGMVWVQGGQGRCGGRLLLAAGVVLFPLPSAPVAAIARARRTGQAERAATAIESRAARPYPRRRHRSPARAVRLAPGGSESAVGGRRRVDRTRGSWNPLDGAVDAARLGGRGASAPPAQRSHDQPGGVFVSPSRAVATE